MFHFSINLLLAGPQFTAAQKLGDRHVFSWKPNPNCVVDPYDADWTRREIRQTLEITRGCVVEMILKDTHTCGNRPERMSECARIASEEVENLSYRTKIRYWPTLRLRYDTTPEQVRTIRDRITESLEQNEQVYEDPLRVRFTDFDNDAILIKVHSFIKTTDYAVFLGIAEDINFQIKEIVKSAGASFALPRRAIYMEGDKA